jgi:hypothetical protein
VPSQSGRGDQMDPLRYRWNKGRIEIQGKEIGPSGRLKLRGADHRLPTTQLARRAECHEAERTIFGVASVDSGRFRTVPGKPQRGHCAPEWSPATRRRTATIAERLTGVWPWPVTS